MKFKDINEAKNPPKMTAMFMGLKEWNNNLRKTLKFGTWSDDQKKALNKSISQFNELIRDLKKVDWS